MNWILLLIKYGPSVFKIVKDVIDLIKRSPENEQFEYKNELAQAVSYYKLTKDKDHLKVLRTKIKEKVNGADH